MRKKAAWTAMELGTAMALYAVVAEVEEKIFFRGQPAL